MPIPWGGTEAPYGFGPGAAQPWIPQPADWADAHRRGPGRATPDSTLAFYREALRIRREFAHSAGERVEMLDLGPDVLAFRRGPIRVVLNCGTAPVELPEGELLLASGPVNGKLPADTAAWLR